MNDKQVEPVARGCCGTHDVALLAALFTNTITLIRFSKNFTAKVLFIRTTL